MSESLKVLIIDTLSNKVLFECPMEELESAYRRAGELEEMGLLVKVMAPSIGQTLTHSLGLNHDEQEDYEQSVVAEMEDHEGSCCSEPTKPEPAQIHAGDPNNIQ